MATIAYPKATPAVMEFQLLNAKINHRLSLTNQSSAIAYWLDEMGTRTNAIAKSYGLTVNALITEWEQWVAAVELVQAQEAN